MLYEFIFISLLFCRTSWVFVVRLPRSPVQVRPSNTSLPERDGRYYEILGDSRARHCFNWVRLLKRFKEKLVMPSGKVCCKARHRDTKTRMKALGMKTGNLFQIFKSFDRQCRLKVPSGHWTQCTERVVGVWKSAFSKLVENPNLEITHPRFCLGHGIFRQSLLGRVLWPTSAGRGPGCNDKKY